MPERVAVALTIAGSDPSGGAGIQADLLTFAAFGLHAASVVTALTVQNTRGVLAARPVDPELVGQQLDAVLEDLDVAAAKTGMLGAAPVIDAVVGRLRAHPVPHLVVDPVLRSTSGHPLLEPAGIAVLRERLLPLATLVTPNLQEAEILTGRPVGTPAEMRDAARALVDLGARAALVTGGHLAAEARDVLWDGRALHELVAARIATPGPLHGAGCTLAAAVTAGLALGHGLEQAVAEAKRYVGRAIETAPVLGHGARPLNHLTSLTSLRRR